MQKDIHAVLCPQKAINKAERRRARQAMLDRKLGNGPPPPVPARPRESIDELPVEDIVTLGWKLQQQSELNGLSPPTSPRRPPRATDTTTTTTTTDAVDEKGAAQANDAALLAKLEMSQANADEAAARHAEQRQYRMSMRVDELVAGIGTDEMLLKVWKSVIDVFLNNFFFNLLILFFKKRKIYLKNIVLELKNIF